MPLLNTISGEKCISKPSASLSKSYQDTLPTALGLNCWRLSTEDYKLAVNK
jgi:hypothetical protein